MPRLAPGLFSTITGRPIDFVSAWATSRAAASDAPPGGTPMRSLIGRSGYSARTGRASPSSRAANASERVFMAGLRSPIAAERSPLAAYRGNEYPAWRTFASSISGGMDGDAERSFRPAHRPQPARGLRRRLPSAQPDARGRAAGPEPA